MTPSEHILQQHLDSSSSAWEALGFDFHNGDCHNLALALLETLGTGKLLAGCHYKDSAPTVPTEYYHMVYQAEDGYTWDIDGKHAIENWEEAFGTGDFVWIEVAPGDLNAWLTEHNATLNMNTVAILKKDLSAITKHDHFNVTLEM